MLKYLNFSDSFFPKWSKFILKFFWKPLAPSCKSDLNPFHTFLFCNLYPNSVQCFDSNVFICYWVFLVKIYQVWINSNLNSFLCIITKIAKINCRLLNLEWNSKQCGCGHWLTHWIHPLTGTIYVNVCL